MKSNNNRSGKNFYAFTSAALALVLMVVASVALIQHDSTAGAESVTLTENATVVTSPFTEAVEKVRGSVVGVNNYTTYRNSYYGFGLAMATAEAITTTTPAVRYCRAAAAAWWWRTATC